MLKRIIASVLTSICLLSLNDRLALAESDQDFIMHKTFYPSKCKIAFDDDVYNCDSVVIGALDNGDANIKLCKTEYCLILIISSTELRNIAEDRDFKVYHMAWQTGDSIVRRWNTSVICGFSSSTAMGCLGIVGRNQGLAIYMK